MGFAFLCYGLSIVGFVPLTEGSSINLNDGALNKSVGSDKLIVRCIVHDTDNPRLPCNVLRAPCKVATFQAEGTILQVSSADTDSVNTLSSELGVGGLTTELELSLLAVVCALSAGFRAFVPGGTGDTHVGKS